MTTIVLNTANGAVTEYDWAFKSITGSHAADDAAIYTLGGDDDAGAAIAAELRGGKTGGGKMLMIGNVYLALDGAGDGTLIVQGESTDYTYPVAERAGGVSLARPGRGIREPFLGLGYRNAGGADFRLDRLDAEVSESVSRRR